MKIAGRFDGLFVVAFMSGYVSVVEAFSVRPDATTTTPNKSTASPTKIQDVLGKAFCSGLVAASIWSAPAPFAPYAPVEMQTVASAKEMASASGSRVNKDADSLLRYGLPIKNKEVRTGLICS